MRCLAVLGDKLLACVQCFQVTPPRGIQILLSEQYNCNDVNKNCIENRVAPFLLFVLHNDHNPWKHPTLITGAIHDL